MVERFREIEIEGRSMDREALERIARVLAEDGATSVPGVPKLVRALGHRAEAPPDVSAPDRLSAAQPAGEAVGAAIARGVERMVVNDPRTRLGDVEGLHQMRVATRRLRSDLKTFEALVDPEWSQPLREELKWLGCGARRGPRPRRPPGAAPSKARASWSPGWRRCSRRSSSGAPLRVPRS